MEKTGTSSPLALRLRNFLYRRPFFQRFSELVQEKYNPEAAKRDFELSRAPGDVTLKLRSIRLIELFQLEDLGKLHRGILNLFPGIQHEQDSKHTLQSLFKDAADILWTDAPWHVGYVARTKLFVGLPFRRMMIPEWISHVEIKVIKCTASSFAMCLEVYVTDCATEKLVELQSERYVPMQITMKLRLKMAFFANSLEEPIYSLTPRAKVLGQLITWRTEVERIFSKYFSGYFYGQHRSATNGLLPSIEIFELSGAPATESELDRWIHDTRAWWDSFGFDFFFSAFRRRGMFFSWGESRSRFPSTGHRLVFLTESFRYSHHESLHSETHIKMEIDEDINNLTPLITIWHYLQVVRKQIGKLKLIALEKMQLKWWSWFWPRMRRLIRLNSDIQNEAMLMDRLSLEWGARAKRITESQTRHDCMMSLLAYRSVLGQKEEERENLRDAPIKMLGEQIEDLNRQLSHLRTWYAEHLNSRNTWVTYGLTIALGIATLVGGLISLRSEFKSLWKTIRESLKTLLGLSA